MTTAGIARLVRAVERGESDAARRFFARSGWGNAVREVRGQVGRSRLLELSWGDEPQALVVLSPNGGDARVSSWGYSREAPYALTWSSDRLALLDSRYWRETPGDAPLLSAEPSDYWSVGELLSFLRPRAAAGGRAGRIRRAGGPTARAARDARRRARRAAAPGGPGGAAGGSRPRGPRCRRSAPISPTALHPIPGGPRTSGVRGSVAGALARERHSWRGWGSTRGLPPQPEFGTVHAGRD